MKVCIPYTSIESEQMGWDYLLSNFQPDEIFILAKPGQELPATNVFGKGTLIHSYKELPEDHDLVLLAPKEGTYIQGDRPIFSFVHPKYPIYIVGENHKIIHPDEFEGRKIDYKVYIPTDTKDEMFNWTAMTVILYDRKIKFHG